jgi:hypothetical protein
VELWEIETQLFVKELDLPPEVAHWFTIVRWMWHGDFRPLVAAIQQDQALDPAVLNAIVEMIEEGRLKVTPLKRGRPMKPAAEMRDRLAALRYEKQDGNSDAAFREIASAMGMSEQAVRAAVTRWRKARNNK